jgi:hypothetical protein
MAFNKLAFEAIRFRLGRIAKWRRGLRHPDPRNACAADAIDRLASADANTISPDTWAGLAPHIESAALPYAVSDTARDLGFRGKQPTTLDTFLALVTARLTSTPTGAR